MAEKVNEIAKWRARHGEHRNEEEGERARRNGDDDVHFVVEFQTVVIAMMCCWADVLSTLLLLFENFRIIYRFSSVNS